MKALFTILTPATRKPKRSTLPGKVSKQIAALLFSFLFIAVSRGQWVKSIGGAGSQFGQAVKVDANGNVFVTGNFAGITDFDPGPGTFNLESSCPCDVSEPRKSDIFLAKYDISGNFLWAIGIGGAEADRGQALALDGAGNVYITGQFGGTADFDPGDGTHNLTSAGNTDIFLAKYDANGQFLWANNFGSVLMDEGTGLAVDINGNAFLTGSFYGTVDFDPGAGNAIFNSNGSEDIFFAKYNTAGSLVWAKDIEGTGEQNGRQIRLGPDGNIYLTGTFFGTTDLDPGAGISTVTGAGSQDPFFAKYNSVGDLLWGKSIGGPFDEAGIDIAVDPTGDMYITGYFGGTTDFDPGAGTTVLTSSPGGLFDAFLLKLNTSGDFQWVFKLGAAGEDNALSVDVDASGNPYICGLYQGTVDFDPGPGVHELTATGNEIYFAKYNAAGDFIWAQSQGGPSENKVAYSIVVDGSGIVYVTGYFSASASFETGGGPVTLTSAGNEDIFLLKFLPTGVLQVSMGAFTARQVGKKVILNWNTFSENNNKGYEVEKSIGTTQLNNWKQIGFVPGNLNSASENNYQFTDNAPGTGKILYRLKQVDITGQSKYSPIALVNIHLPGQYFLDQNIPNPVRHTTAISYYLPERSHVSLAIYDAVGRLRMLPENVERQEGSYLINVNCSGLETGTYYYRLLTDKISITRKMRVVR